MLTEDRINANFLAYVKRLEKYGCYSEELIKDLGENLKYCSYSLNEDSGSAYQGSMIDVVLNTLCKLAYHINENAFGGGDEKIAHPFLKVNIEMLMRVLLLQHIGKCQMFVPQREQWKIKKGYLFDFNENLDANLKLGERSIYLCQKYGIKLNEEEFEAMRIIDKTDEGKSDAFSSPLSIIVKIANILTAIELRRKYLATLRHETIER